MEHFSIVRRIIANNSAIRKIRNILQWWHSLGEVEKSTHATAAVAVHLVESVIMDTISSWAEGDIEHKEVEEKADTDKQRKSNMEKKAKPADESDGADDGEE